MMIPAVVSVSIGCGMFLNSIVLSSESLPGGVEGRLGTEGCWQFMLGMLAMAYKSIKDPPWKPPRKQGLCLLCPEMARDDLI